MTEEIRKAVIHAVSEKFHMPVYGQNVPQGGKRPCFTVELSEVTQKPLLGPRAARRAGFSIQYYCGDEKAAAVESATVADGLYEALFLIGKDEKFAASGMKQEKTADGVRFRMDYEYHVIYTEDEAERMQRLEYNGKETVGYEDIQQRTAE